MNSALEGALEVAMITITPSVGVAVNAALATMFDVTGSTLSTVLEASTIIAPLCAACIGGTVLVPVAWLAAVAALGIHTQCYASPGLAASRLSSDSDVRPRALTQLRAIIMLEVVFCILAVDYKQLFPARYAKSATHGCSLMDLGVGAVVLSGSFVNRRVRETGRAIHSRPQARVGAASAWSTRALELLRRRHAPLFVLGAARTLLIQSSHYGQPADEYGTHWNFFYTLGCVSLAAALITPERATSACALGLAVLTLHELLLSAPQLQQGGSVLAPRLRGAVAARRWTGRLPARVAQPPRRGELVRAPRSARRRALAGRACGGATQRAALAAAV